MVMQAYAAVSFFEKYLSCTLRIQNGGLPLWTFLVLLIAAQTVSAQQAYNNVSGLACTGKYRSCASYTVYRTQSSQETWATVAKLFNITEARLAKANGLKLTTSFHSPPQPLYIPISCSCLNGTSQMVVSHTIASGDTFFGIANSTYEGMTTYQAIEAANPTLNATTLAIGQVVKIPLRCPCATAPQLRNGSRLLLSYVVYPQETLYAISSYFNVSVADLQAANELTTSNIEAFSTLLVPLVRLPVLSNISFIVPTPVSVSPPPSSGVRSPVPAPAPAVVGAAAAGDPSNKPLYIGIGIGAFGLILAAIFAVLLALLTCRRPHKEKAGVVRTESEIYLKKDVGGNPNTAFRSDLLAEMSGVVGADRPAMFTYDELRLATEDFSDNCRIEGSVYRGILQGVPVAIKQMKSNMTQELKILSQLHHGNVVRLVGICISSLEHIYLVYEYAENGSLSDCLHQADVAPDSRSVYSRSSAFLPWTRRVQIALDVASGLEYIHNYTNPSFVHKDVKSSNILLDGHFRAKVANFGMAKSADSSGPGPMLTKHIVGTQGYMAPEYYEHGLVTTKADVFSFGVVLLEILSGQDAIVMPAAGENGPGRERMLSSIIQVILEGDNQVQKLQAWMDPLLQGAYPPDTAFRVASLAKMCVDPDPALRPTMKDITYALSKMLSASLEWESSTVFTSGVSDVSIEAR